MHLVYLNLIPSLDRDAEGIKVISEVSCGSEGILHNIIPGSGSGEEAPPLYLAPTGAQGVKMLCVRVCRMLFKRTLKMSMQASKHARGPACKFASTQTSKESEPL